MTFGDNLVAGLQTLTAAVRANRVLLNGNAANLTALTTTNKGNLVLAINELVTRLGSATGGVNDATVSTSTVYSSQKVVDLLTQYKNDLLGGAGAAYDTLKELQDLMAADDTADNAFVNATNTALGNRVRYDTAQTLTAQQKVVANSNIGSVSLVDFGDPNTDFVAVVTAALA